MFKKLYLVRTKDSDLIDIDNLKKGEKKLKTQKQSIPTEFNNPSMVEEVSLHHPV